MIQKIQRNVAIAICAFGLFSCTENSAPLKYSQEAVKVPTLFAEGIISSKMHNEFNLEFSPNGKTVYFTRRVDGEPQKILVSTFENNTWSAPKLTSFSISRDEMPSITPNGKQLYFASTRRIPTEESKGNFDMNIWVTEKENDSWSEAKPVDSVINKVQIEGEKWPSSNESSLYTQDGKTFYYSTMMRNSKGIGIYTTTLENGKFSTPKRIEGLLEDEKYWISGPTLSPDGNYLLFNAYGVKGGVGGEDLYASKKTENGWSKAVSLGNIINTKHEEGAAKFSRDGHCFFFTRDDKISAEEDGIWSIYYIETSYLKLESLFN
ncbi:PD40 domain-containing protein [Kordia sp. YSTF-M3]|uniref:PD40 domain-containing protein n=1 Tax=Kordia aestuariivivens TaxID=2759037 RepID=A0ABR7Q924_9FLAO|nr:PD40 domain-containing protein [Kordia aestuariivivens]MBC8755055.1 PD40 domain-containing protein [Kordia aestuariivivens]